MSRKIGFNQRGVVLILTFIIMVSLIVVASSYIFLVTYDTRNVGGQKSNVSAFYLAEAGLNKAIYYLLNTAPDSSTDSSWRTTAYPAVPGAGNTDPQQESLGGGTYTMWVETSGSDVQITARGTANGIERIIRQAVSYSAGGSVPEALTYANHAGGNVTFDGAHNGTVTGNIGAQGNIEDSSNITVNGTESDSSSIVTPTVDYSEYENIADTVVNGNKTFSKNNTYSGIWYVKGNAIIEKSVTINGSLIVEGDIEIKNVNNVDITATSPYPALVAQGNIDLSESNNINITGPIFSEGNLVFKDIVNVGVIGSMVADGNIEFGDSNNFSVTFASSDPPYFSGGEVGGVGASINAVANNWEEM